MIVFTHHAEQRYRRRIRSHVTLDDVVAGGRVQATAPGALDLATTADAYLLHEDAVFPLVRDGDTLIAVTCLKRRRVSKADRRARRLAAHADWIEVA